jgi:hypothetical protein
MRINNYKSNITIDYVLINIIVTNKYKLHNIYKYEGCPWGSWVPVQGVYSPTGDGVPTGKFLLSCHPIGDKGPIVVVLTASNEKN